MADGLAIREAPGGIVVAFKVVTRSSGDRLGGRYGGCVKLHVTAPPVDDKANARIVRFLADAFSVPAGAVRILKGGHSNRKDIFLPVARAVFEARLAGEGGRQA
jgi:uncharacterized protein (TIGR00251 family)